MRKSPRNSRTTAIIKVSTSTGVPAIAFEEVLKLIEAARVQTAAAVNTALIDLYWSIGQYLGEKVAQDGRGQGTVKALADYIRRRLPNTRGFSAQNLWRMRQFFEAYDGKPKLSTLSRELS